MEGNQKNSAVPVPGPPEDEGSTARTWGMVLILAGAFLFWGLLIYFLVGVSWPPPWRYGTIADVPGQSVYGVRGTGKMVGTAPGEEEAKVRPQHVKGPGGEGKKPDGGGR